MLLRICAIQYLRISDTDTDMFSFRSGRVYYSRLFLAVSAMKMPRFNYSCVTEARVKVSQNPTLADQPIFLRIEGLQPQQKITLHASTLLPNAAIFESISHYVANENGIVDLDQDESLGGSFAGNSPMGPLSFMKPSPVNKKKYERFLIKDPSKPFTIDFRVLDSFVNDLDVAELTVLYKKTPHLTITRLYIAHGVREHPVREGRVRGTLYLPEGDGPFPGVISMSGGYPGAMKYKAALLASHGFAAIALKYFGEDDLPEKFLDVDLDYFEEAAMFLKEHPRVNGQNGVGIVANCYGGTIGLALASLGPKRLISSVVSVSGWPFKLGIFSYKGKEFITKLMLDLTINESPDGVTEFKFSFPVDLHDTHPLKFAEESSFPFQQRHETAYMFVAGSKDGYYDGDQICGFLGNLLKTCGHPKFEILYYPDAGHLIEHSFYPFCDTVRTFGEFHHVGGQQPYHSDAQIDSWPKILEFTRRNLEGKCKVKL